MANLSGVLDGLPAFFWQPMEKQPAYGAFHLLFVLIFGAISIFAAWKCRKLGEKGNRRLLLAVGAFLLVSEVGKQLFYMLYLHGDDGAYPWRIFPFQLCSVPMYLCLIAPFLKPGKALRGIYTFMMLYNLLGGAISFAEPSGLLNEYWFLTLHSFFWHMSLVFLGLYLAFSHRGGRTGADFRLATRTFLALCTIAFAINLIFWEASEGSINMFFVGPRNSSLIVFSQIAERFGWYVSTLLYIPSVCLGAYLIFLPIHRSGKGSLTREPATVK